jgi:hypothetical protein
MYHTGVQPLVTVDALQATQHNGPQQPNPIESCHDRLLRSLSHRPVDSSSGMKGATKTVSSYIDAGVQTDSPPTTSSPPPPIQTDFDEYRPLRHIRDSSSASSSSSIFTSYSSELSTRRSSVVEDHNLKQVYQSFNYLPNPVLMGRMQDYFRASGYRLGDALKFETVS